MDSGTGERGGTGRTADWIRCRQFRNAVSKPVLLAGGLDPENVGEAISMVKPFGVDVQSGVEDTIHKVHGSKVRIKSITKILRFLQSAKLSASLDS